MCLCIKSVLCIRTYRQSFNFIVPGFCEWNSHNGIMSSFLLQFELTLTITSSKFTWVTKECSYGTGTIHFHSLIYDSWICVGVEKTNPKRRVGKDFFLYLNINNRKRLS